MLWPLEVTRRGEHADQEDGGEAPPELAAGERGDHIRRRPVSGRGEVHDGFLAGVGAGELAGLAALGHDEDAVGEEQELGQLGGDHEDGEALGGEGCGSARRSPAWRRRRCRGSARRGAGRAGAVASHLPMTTFCWLPPERRGRRLLDAGAADAEAADGVAGDARPRRRGRRRPKRRDAAERGQRDVVADRGGEEQALGLAVLGDERDAGRRAARGRGDVDGAAVEADAAGGAAVGGAEERLEDLGAAGAEQAADAEDLAGVQVEVDAVSTRRQPWRPGTSRVRPRTERTTGPVGGAARGRAAGVSRPTIARDEPVAATSRRWARSTTWRPSRSTVTRSASSITSSMRWEM